MPSHHLVIIDPQNDFCDPSGALYVKGAEKDMERLADFISKNRKRLDDIQVTLDSHQVVHIAHPIFWVDTHGKHPSPFTLIQVSDVENGKWRANSPGWQKRALEYVRALKANGRYVLCIWPPHCLIGSWGHSIFPAVSNALREYQETFADVQFVTKGSNPLTEHYSAVRADVIDPADPSTNINASFIQRLQDADRVLISGQASSHCVFNTLRDIVDQFGAENANKIVLLQDTMSPVPGFENLHADLMAYCNANSISIANSTEIFV